MVNTVEPRRLVLVRHGRTALNREDRLRGLADPPLDDIGIEQARALVPDRSALGVSVLLASPLIRAVDTAGIIGRGLGVPHLADARFTDRDYGPWTGHLRQDVIDRFGSVDDAPGVEPVEQVMARIRPALESVLQGEGRTVAIVTHDAVIRPLLMALDPDVGSIRAPNGSWNELQRTDSGWRVVQIDRVPRAERGGRVAVPPTEVGGSPPRPAPFLAAPPDTRSK